MASKTSSPSTLCPNPATLVSYYLVGLGMLATYRSQLTGARYSSRWWPSQLRVGYQRAPDMVTAQAG